jgi:sialate O-acetylesterase
MSISAITTILRFLMRPKQTLTFILLLFALAAESASGSEFSVASIFSDGMVLQRGEPVPVWGWADPGTTVAVDFNGQKKNAVVGDDGAWQVKLDAMKALNTGQPMVVVCGDDSKTI